MPPALLAALLQLATNGLPAPQPTPRTVHFYKIEVPAPVVLAYNETIQFEVSDKTQRELAAAGGTALYLRIYRGKLDVLASRTDADKWECVYYDLLEREPFTVVTRSGKHYLTTRGKVGQTWFYESQDTEAVIVIHRENAPERATRIHKDLIKQYFESGVQARVRATNPKDGTVHPTWRGGASGEKSTYAYVPTEVTSYKGYLVKWVPQQYLEVADLDDRHVDRVDLTGHTFERNDATLVPGERVFLQEIKRQGETPRVSIRNSDYPECIRSAPPPVLRTDSSIGPPLVAEVRRCEPEFTLAR